MRVRLDVARRVGVGSRALVDGAEVLLALLGLGAGEEDFVVGGRVRRGRRGRLRAHGPGRRLVVDRDVHGGDRGLHGIIDRGV